MQQPVDRQSFDRLLVDALPGLQRFANRLTGDVDAAEELAQEAVYRAARAWQSFKGQSQFRTWLFQIAINLFRDRHSASKRFAGELTDQLPDAHRLGPSEPMETLETGHLVAQLVSRLPPKQREVLVLITYEQLDHAEVARILGMSEQNVRVNLHHARQRLKQQLMPYLMRK